MTSPAPEPTTTPSQRSSTHSYAADSTSTPRQRCRPHPALLTALLRVQLTFACMLAISPTPAPCMHGHHASHDTAPTSLFPAIVVLASPLRSQGPHARPGRTSSPFELVPPFEVDDAFVAEQPVSQDEAQVQYEDALQRQVGGLRSGGARALLHGRRKLKAWPQCPRCGIVVCSGSSPSQGDCSGHCRKSKQLFWCRWDFRFPPELCPPDPDASALATLQPDTLVPSLQRTLVALAPAPFMGCANVTGRSSGCPLRNTRAVVGDGTSINGLVVESTCIQHLYPPYCGIGPFYPFGYCECVMATSGQEAYTTRPCNISELRFLGQQIENASDVYVDTAREPGFTFTGFNNLTAESGKRTDTYNYTFDVGDVELRVTLEVFHEKEAEGTEFRQEGIIEEYEAAEDAQGLTTADFDDGGLAPSARFDTDPELQDCFERVRQQRLGGLSGADEEGLFYFDIDQDRSACAPSGATEAEGPEQSHVDAELSYYSIE